MSDPRTEAEQYFREGWCGIAAAFDLADCRRWRFESDVQQRAMSLLDELKALFRASEMKPNARVIREEAAAGDKDFKQFMRSALRKRATRPAKAARPNPASTEPPDRRPLARRT